MNISWPIVKVFWLKLSSAVTSNLIKAPPFSSVSTQIIIIIIYHYLYFTSPQKHDYKTHIPWELKLWDQTVHISYTVRIL